MTETQLKEWKRQAKKDGLSDDYEYHLGMIANPLPYLRWKMKFKLLEQIQSIPESSPRYFAPETFRREKELCNELGY